MVFGALFWCHDDTVMATWYVHLQNGQPGLSPFISALQKSAQQWFKEGNVLDDLKRHEEAIAAYEQAIRPGISHSPVVRLETSLIIALPSAVSRLQVMR